MLHQEYCKCKVKIQNGVVFAYFCDENGDHAHNFSKHIKLKSVLNKFDQEGWEIVSVWRPKSDQIIYTLKRV